MASPLFSTFKGGENRVTSSTMSVFERVDLSLVQELLETAIEGPGELVAVTFENQVVGDGSVPDARIAARFAWWFETKTERGAYAAEGHGRTQLRGHAKQLVADADAQLFVLTPDAVAPRWLEVLDGVEPTVRPRIRWISFAGLAHAIEQILGDPSRLIGEQTRFLLSELRTYYEAEGLTSNDDTVVVAARYAWNHYLDYHAYICQPGRSFKEGLHRLGFYHAGRIEPVVPEILAWYPVVVATESGAEVLEAQGEAGERAAAAIRAALRDGSRVEGEEYGVTVLTSPDDERTLRLNAPILNDTRTATGRAWAWTLGQRYTASERLGSGVHTTSELETR